MLYSIITKSHTTLPSKEERKISGFLEILNLIFSENISSIIAIFTSSNILLRLPETYFLN